MDERLTRRGAGAGGPARLVTLLRIARLGARGDGIAELAGGRSNVAGALPASWWRLHSRARGDGVAARLGTILEPSPERRAPPCRHFGGCGGCAHAASLRRCLWRLEASPAAETLRRAGLVPAPLRRWYESRSHPPAVDLVARAARGRVGLGFTNAAAIARRHRPVRDPAAGLQACWPRCARARSGAGRGMSADLLATDGDAGIDLLVRAARSPTLAARQALAGLASANIIARIAWQEPGSRPSRSPCCAGRP